MFRVTSSVTRIQFFGHVSALQETVLNRSYYRGKCFSTSMLGLQFLVILWYRSFLINSVQCPTTFYYCKIKTSIYPYKLIIYIWKFLYNYRYIYFLSHRIKPGLTTLTMWHGYQNWRPILALPSPCKLRSSSLFLARPIFNYVSTLRNVCMLYLLRVRPMEIS